MSYEDYEDEPYVIIEKHSGGTGGFLLGLAIGAGLALLMAPQSGRKTRRDIERRAREARRRADELARDVSERVATQVERARAELEARIEQARRELDFRRQQVQSAVEAGRVAARDAREELERRIADTKAAYQAGVAVGRERAAASDRAGAAGESQGEADASNETSGGSTRRAARGVGRVPEA